MSDMCGDHCSAHLEKAKIVCSDVCWQKAKSVSSESIGVNDLCAVNANINTLCVTNLTAPNFTTCNTSRAYLGFSAPFAYTLGNVINFNVVLDDPSSISSMVPNTHFTAPSAGYWDVSAFINASNLQGAAIIVGNPVASLSLQVNGVSRASIYTPFLSFSPAFTDSIAANLYLNAGDVVTAVLNVLVQSGAGVAPYVGTMTLSGGPLPATVDPSTLSMVLVSNLCTASATPGQGAACVTCVPVVGPDCPTVNPCHC